MKKNVCLLIPIFICIMTAACGVGQDSPVNVEGYHMGTIITERVFGKNAKRAAEQVMGRMEEVEKTMTINVSGGDINSLNDMAGKESVKLRSDAMFVLQSAYKFAELSRGAFDVTVGPLVKAWGIFTDHSRVPSDEEIKKLLGLVDYRSLSLDKESGTAKLQKEGQIVDLGGVAKGYAGDEAIRIYKENGIKSAFVNIGGNVVVLGHKPDGSPWSIGIQNPRAQNGVYIGIVKVADKAVVSSGDYERYFIKDNIRYHHIIDPRTGYPSDSGLIGTTVIADKSIDADALSTAAFVLGLEEGMKLIESIGGVDAVFITKDKKVYTTSGLKDKFIFEDESKEYQYVEKR